MTAPFLLQYNHAIRTEIQIGIIPAAVAIVSALEAAMNGTPYNWATLAVVDNERDGLSLRRHFDNQFRNAPGQPFTLPKRCPRLRNSFLIQYNHTNRTPKAHLSIITADKAGASARLNAGALLPYAWATVAVLTHEEDAESVREIIHATIKLHRASRHL